MESSLLKGGLSQAVEFYCNSGFLSKDSVENTIMSVIWIFFGDGPRALEIEKFYNFGNLRIFKSKNSRILES